MKALWRGNFSVFSQYSKPPARTLPYCHALGNCTALQDSPKAARAKKNSHPCSCSPSALLHCKVSLNPVGSEAFTGPRYNESHLQPDSTCGAALLTPMYNKDVWNGEHWLRLRVSLGSTHLAGPCCGISYGQACCSSTQGSAEDRLVPPMLALGTRISNKKCWYVRGSGVS